VLVVVLQFRALRSRRCSHGLGDNETITVTVFGAGLLMFTFGYFMVRVTNKAAVGVINKQVTTLWRHIVECGEHVVRRRAALQQLQWLPARRLYNKTFFPAENIIAFTGLHCACKLPKSVLRAALRVSHHD